LCELQVAEGLQRTGSGVPQRAAEQSLAADGATACFSSSLIQSAWMLIARRS